MRPGKRRSMKRATGSSSGRGRRWNSARHLLVRVAGVARQRLVAAVARQRDRDVAAGHLGQQITSAAPRDRRTARRRRAPAGAAAPRRAGAAPPRGGRSRTGAPPGGRRYLGEILLLEADRERLDRLRADLAHDRDHRRRIDAARQERPERHVRHQPHLHRFEQVVAQLLDEVLRRALARLEAQVPVALLGQLAVLEHGDAARRQLAHPRDRGEVRRHVAERQVGVHRARIGAALDVAVGEQRLQLRRERQPALADVEEERLLAEAIAPQHQPPPRRVPNREREHAAHLADERRSVQPVELEQHLGVGARAQRDARVAQPGREIAEVVDLAVEHQHHLAVGAQHRLVGVGRQVDDRQAGVPEDGGPVLVHARRVGPAVVERVRHRAHQRLRVGGTPPCLGARDVTGYAAHGVASRAESRTSRASRTGPARAGTGRSRERAPPAPSARQRSGGSARAAASASTSGARCPVGTSQPVSPGATMPSRFAAWLKIAGSPDAQASSATLGSPSQSENSTSRSDAQ